jgi:phosphoribosylglycinamide formyltransferase-1
VSSSKADAPQLPIVVLISGAGTNMLAIVEAARRGLPIEVRAVLSDRPAAAGLARAHALGIPAAALPPEEYPDRAAHDVALAARIEGYAPRLVVLAGYLRILSPAFVAQFAGRLVNIHPSLLPQFRGLNTHHRALAAGVAEHGATVHFVVEELDAGPRIAQVRVQVLPGDSVSSLAARVLAREHVLYPTVLGWFASGRLEWRDGAAWLDGRRLNEPVQLTDDHGPH